MRLVLKSLLMVAVLVLFGKTAFAFPLAPSVKIEGRYWFADLDGKIVSASGSVTGTDLDFVKDLGLGNENFPEVRLQLGIGGSKLRYAYVPMSWDGTKTVTGISFGGQTFNGSVKTGLDLTYHRLAYRYDIIDTLDNRVGVIIELKYLDGEASIASLATTEVEQIALPVPTIGVGGGISLPYLLNVSAEATGIGISGDKYIVDAEAMLNFNPVPMVMISGGYRYFALRFDEAKDSFDVSVKGPFISVQAGF